MSAVRAALEGATDEAPLFLSDYQTLGVLPGAFTTDVAEWKALMVYSEIAGIIRRHRHMGLLDADDFNAARQLLSHEFFSNPDLTLLNTDEAAMLASVGLGDAHNLNPTGAVLLYVFREFARETGEPCWLVSSDLHLLRAANAEGLTPLNPETTHVADLVHYVW